MHLENVQWNGPTTNIWHHRQCPFLGNIGAGHTVSQCKKLCEEKEGCTSFNYGAGGRCSLRGCSLPVPVPSWNHTAYEGYYVTGM